MATFGPAGEAALVLYLLAAAGAGCLERPNVAGSAALKDPAANSSGLRGGVGVMSSRVVEGRRAPPHGAGTRLPRASRLSNVLGPWIHKRTQ